MRHTTKDANRGRSLAEAVVGMARTPEMAAILARWADVNALRKPDRAPVWCRPVGCWREIITADQLQCTDPEVRSIGYGVLQILHKHDIGDDHPVDDAGLINALIRVRVLHRCICQRPRSCWSSSKR